MIRSLPSSFLSALCLAGAMLSGCGDTQVAGGGTETGNAEIAGRILDSDGRGLTGMTVNLREVRTRSDGSDPSPAQSAVTDDSGGYRFKTVAEGRYVVHASEPASSGAYERSAILTRLEKKDKALKLQDATAREGVLLKGRVIPPAGTGLGEIVICVAGAMSCTHPMPDSVWSLPQAPKGAYELLFLTPDAVHYLAVQVRAETGATVYLRDAVLKDSADASHVPYRFYPLPQAKSFSMTPVAYPKGNEPAWYQGKDFAAVNYFLLSETGPDMPWAPDYFAAWKFSRTLGGDSLYTGPDLAKPLAGFPLPIRLASPGFDFSQAAPDGSDLIVSDTTGRLLPFEIERWDAAGGRAEIWVRVDTLAAAKADRKLRLHWGRQGTLDPNAPPLRADGGSVFLPTDGFLGAWHFNEADVARITDARGGIPGTFVGPLPPEGAAGQRTADGAVGPALRMGRTGAFVRVPYLDALDVTETFTVSAWARLRLPDNGLKQLLAAKWMPGKREWHFDIQPNRTFELEFGDAAGNIQGTWRSTAPVANPEAWHQYAAVFDKGVVKLYLDGVEVAGTGATGTVPAAIRNFGADMSFGSNSIDTTLNLRGDLDEFRLYHAAKSAEWLGMTYLTEKPRP